LKETVKAKSRLWASIDEGCFGPGTATLLEFVAKTGSIKKACDEMGMSYRKAFNVLNDLERELGYAVLSRQQGGKDGGRSVLTEEGKELLQRYERFVAECDDFVKKAFDKHFKGFTYSDEQDKA